LKAFQKLYGHTKIPSHGEWESLYHWLLRNKKRKNGPHNSSAQLTNQQIDKLDALGIDWSVGSGSSDAN